MFANIVTYASFRGECTRKSTVIWVVRGELLVGVYYMRVEEQVRLYFFNFYTYIFFIFVVRVLGAPVLS